MPLRERAPSYCNHDRKRPHYGIVLGHHLYKMRVATGGKGKSGGSRVVYYYRNHLYPAYLLAVFGKNERTNLTKAEQQNLTQVANMITKTLGE